jgi:diadenylate cyclase
MAKTTKPEPDFARAMLQAATRVAEETQAAALFVFTHAIDDLAELQAAIQPPTKLILVNRDEQDEKRARTVDAISMLVPAFDLTRIGQIKMATLLAFSQQILKGNDAFVFLAGVSGRAPDTLVVMRVGEEYELFQSVGQPKLTEHIRRVVFERVVTIALELAHEGREGKPVGGLFVVGDHREVQKYCLEGRINPFKGYTEKERNILDDSVRETVKELAKLDGAFILKGTGVIISAGTILRPALAGKELPQGLGSRHATAAAVTASTKSIAITLSESTGTVRIWRRGEMITEIERASGRMPGPTMPPPAAG